MSEINTSNLEPEALLEEVEIEAYGRDNRQPPHAQRYVIRIDKKTFRVEHQIVNGRGLLELSGKDPVRHKLYQKLHGGQLKEIGADERVDLGARGIERFQTVPLNETEG